MAAKKIGAILKEARTAAGLTQEQLAKKVDGVTAADISKTERGEKDLTQAQLKQAAKALGVTQASLLNAPKNVSSSAKKPASSAKKSTSKNSSMKVTSSEKKLLELYRAADADTRKAAVNILKGTQSVGDFSGMLNSLLGGMLGKTGTRELHLLDDDEEFDFHEVFDPDK